ncbi:MAG: alpha/beta fold hydrolase [Myxococcales bacterium FL481]|nr:MAG: alpha/beta fold hydrolase [Myxococcales bacterium FL481]
MRRIVVATNRVCTSRIRRSRLAGLPACGKLAAVIARVSIRHAYLHGFRSDANSVKGTWLAERYLARGKTLERLDLNRPSFRELTLSGALAALDEAHAAGPASARWRLVGSSMGGYVAALWSASHPERVDRAVLLCPAFGFARRWEALIGAAGMQAWQQTGWRTFVGPGERESPVHWALVEDMRRHPEQPAIACPTVIVHGRRDTVVPLSVSRGYAETNPSVELTEVDDDHAMVDSLETIGDITASFLLEG